MELFVVVVAHIQRIGCEPEKTTLHGGQYRSWSAEQGKTKRKKSLEASPPPPRAARSEKKKKRNHATHPHIYLGATQVGVTQVVSVVQYTG